MKPGDKVRLVTPENARLDGAPAEVESVTAYGVVYVRCAAAGSGRFRALVEELEPATAAPEAVHADGSARTVRQARAAVNARAQAKASGYTGDICEACGSVRMRRNGSCLLCEDCLTNGGCG